jgi:L-amino acid N-acyltransferase YncA
MSAEWIRNAQDSDVEAILRIFNEAIAGGIANTETETKDVSYMREWLREHDDRYAVFVYERDERVAGYASLNPYYPRRTAYRGVADLSYYVAAAQQRGGVGSALIRALLAHAIAHKFHKCVARSFTTNEASRNLLRRFGFRRVGVFVDDALVAGRYRSVAAYEKVFPAVLERDDTLLGIPQSQRRAGDDKLREQ